MNSLVITRKLLKLWFLRKEKVLEELNRELELCDSVLCGTHPSFRTSGILGWIINNKDKSIEEYRKWQEETKLYVMIRKSTIQKRIELVNKLLAPDYKI